MRDGFIEYACFCGHSFLKAQKIEGKIRHPAICVVAGHFIHFLTRRAGYAEYVCRNCGHPFCFADPESKGSIDSVDERNEHRDVVLDSNSSPHGTHISNILRPA